MPQPANAYTIQKDPPWVQKTSRVSHAPSCSVYSEDDYQSRLNEQDMPEVPPLKLQKAHIPRSVQHMDDHGPQVRQSRLPIFRQVRSMLQKQPPAVNTRDIGRPRDTSSSREPKAADAKHSSRKSSKGFFEVKRHWPERSSSSSIVVSPLSVLQDDGMEQSIPPGSDWDDFESSPVSTLSEDLSTHNQNYKTISVSANTRAYAQSGTPTPVARIISIRRKPAPRDSRLPLAIPEATSSPSPPPSRDSHVREVSELEPPARNLGSRFSWTSYAPSGTHSFDVASRPSLDRPSLDRPSLDRPSTGRPSADLARARHLSRDVEHLPISRFSWSTVNTGMLPNQARPDSPPPSPPAVGDMSPHKFKTPPVQSILSRHRPIQRLEREEWLPQSRKSSLSNPAATDTAPSVKTKLSLVTTQTTTSSTDNQPGSTQKSLPPPPDMLKSASPVSHLETLLRQEESLALQKRNIEKAIIENAKIESASPMEVSFGELREAKKKLETLRARLEEIALEQRDIGIAIARARRREGREDGAEEGLWVRRITG